MLILPSHKLLPMLSPFFLLGTLIAVTMLAFSSILGQLLLALLLGGLSLGLLGLLVPLKPLTPFSYFLELQLIVLLGWRDYLLSNYRVTWDLIASTRQ
ncbi:MAG TPA: hypothetical protein VK983_00305, partial [Candidatus Limnocylindrales bacterium]|nr:hypothetical protein [Candidatus Limnocylindrales bacterium]